VRVDPTISDNPGRGARAPKARDALKGFRFLETLLEQQG
jgi:hypothetical protein